MILGQTKVLGSVPGFVTIVGVSEMSDLRLAVNLE